MTRWPQITLALAISLIASAAFAAPTLPGINIRWDNCVADGGVMNRSFACDVNFGVDTAVLSAQLDTPMSDVSGMEIRISVKTSDPVLPAWWDFRRNPVDPPVGICRPTSLSFVASPFLSSVNCEDWGQGQQIGGIGAYRVDEIGPGSAVILIAAAVPSQSLVALNGGTEYVVGALAINHLKSVGTGSCSGCSTPACILFSSLNVTTPVLENNRLLTHGASGTDSQIIRWQNGTIQNLINECTGTFACNTQFDCVNANPTAARRSTWGQVKSLYH